MLMQGMLQQKKAATIKEVASFAIAEVAINNLSDEQRKCALTLISNCWVYGKDFAASLAA